MTDGQDFDEPLPHTWLDAFPWLRAAARDDAAEPWWDEPLEASEAADRETKLKTIGELAIERLTGWTIGQIFPGLAPETQLRRLDLPTRARNVFDRGGYLTAEDLSPITLGTIIEWRNVGIGTVSGILRALAGASMTSSTPTVAATPQPSAGQFSHQPEEARLPGWLMTLLDDITEIAGWQVALGLPADPLLGDKLPEGIPGEVLKARSRLAALSAEQVLTDGELQLDVATLLDIALDELDERAVQILKHRFFADDPDTLDQLGDRFGVTRERVRQIEGKARAAVLDSLSAGTLGQVADAARTLIGAIRPLSDLIRLMPAMGAMVTAVDQPAWRVIDRLDDAYEIEDGWCVVPTLTAAQDWTSTQLQERADKFGVVRLDELDLVETSIPEERDELTRAWLEACGYIVDGPSVLTRTQSVGDYAAAILSMHGEPLSAQEIVERFAFERTTGSLKNAMSTDDRFERVDRDQWALADWGMEAYANIRAVIRKELAKNGGTIPIDTLVERITGTYSVTSSSVIAYASSPPFDLRNGIVRPAGTSRDARKPPERTARLYRRGESWIYRIRISHDHLRGSGSVAPVAITSILGMEYGDKVQLASDLGDQNINWVGTQPAFGTIRRYLLEYDVASGTDAFLVIGDDRSFNVEVIDRFPDDPLADALTLVGAPPVPDAEEARQELAAAIRLPNDSPVVSIIGAYRERGDGDVADLLTSVRHQLETGESEETVPHSADVDDIMDLL